MDLKKKFDYSVLNGKRVGVGDTIDLAYICAEEEKELLLGVSFDGMFVTQDKYGCAVLWESVYHKDLEVSVEELADQYVETRLKKLNKGDMTGKETNVLKEQMKLSFMEGVKYGEK